MTRARHDGGWSRTLAGLVLCGGLANCAGDSDSDPVGAAGAAGGSGDARCPSDLPSNDICPTSTPSYANDAAPIFAQRCETCHYEGNNVSRYVFSERSDVYDARQTVLTRIYGCVMPPDGAPQLSADERSVLLRWLVCGAPDN